MGIKMCYILRPVDYHIKQKREEGHSGKDEAIQNYDIIGMYVH